MLITAKSYSSADRPTVFFFICKSNYELEGSEHPNLKDIFIQSSSQTQTPRYQCDRIDVHGGVQVISDRSPGAMARATQHTRHMCSLHLDLCSLVCASVSLQWKG